MSSQRTWKPGDVVAGSLVVIRAVGEGGMGEVYEVSKKYIGRDARFALKTVRASTHPRDFNGLRARFKREARIIDRLNHPNIVEIHDVIDVNGAPALLMELMQGESLREFLKQAKTVTLTKAAEILCPVLAAVGAAHENKIVHRDLTPSNIFLAQMPDGTSCVKVLDFGVAMLLQPDVIPEETEAPRTETDATVGTPYYSSPEQASGEKIDEKSDIWAIGIIAFEMLAGRRPLPSGVRAKFYQALLSKQVESFRRALPELPEAVTTMLDRCLAFERHERPDARTLHDTLSPYAGQAVAAGMTTPGRGEGGRRSWVIWAAPALAIAAVVAFILLASRSPGDRQKPDAGPETSSAGNTTETHAVSEDTRGTSTTFSAPAPPDTGSVPPSTASASPPRPVTTPVKPSSSASSEPHATLPATASSTATAPPPPTTTPATSDSNTIWSPTPNDLHPSPFNRDASAPDASPSK